MSWAVSIALYTLSMACDGEVDARSMISSQLVHLIAATVSTTFPVLTRIRFERGIVAL